MRILGVVFATACAMGCASPSAEVSEAARSLGIVEFEVTNGASRLAIRGLDERGDELARVDLSIGRFVMRREVDDRGEVYGRQLRITVGDDVADHESEGIDLLQLPLGARARSIAAVALDPQVASALAMRGVTFETVGSPDLAALPDQEIAYDWMDRCQTEIGGFPQAVDSSGFVGPCTACTAYPPTSNCGSVSCRTYQKYAGQNKYGQFTCCGNSGLAAERACSTPGANAGCGTNGSGGCATCWTSPWEEHCEVTTQTSTVCRMDWCAV